MKNHLLIYEIEGMTCPKCAQNIKKALEKNGYYNFLISFEDGNLKTDDKSIDLKKLNKIINEYGYYANINKQNRKGEVITLVLMVIVIAGYLYFNSKGSFNLFPTANRSMGISALFVLGLLTGLHCFSMCGGICISVSAIENTNGSKLKLLKTPLLYNLGRVISYTIIGALFGMLGSFFSINDTMRGIVMVFAGFFMLIMGINMLGVFPLLRRYIPKIQNIKVSNKFSRFKNTPLFIGLLNGFIPCGPLQAMQIYALGTGSFILGALSMLSFSLGTVPLLVLVGTFGSLLKKKQSKILLKAGAFLVFILGLSMFGNGLAFLGIVF